MRFNPHPSTFHHGMGGSATGKEVKGMDFLTRVTLNHEKAKEIFEKLEKAESLLREVYMDVDSSVSVSIEAPVNSEDCDRQEN